MLKIGEMTHYEVQNQFFLTLCFIISSEIMFDHRHCKVGKSDLFLFLRKISFRLKWITFELKNRHLNFSLKWDKQVKCQKRGFIITLHLLWLLLLLLLFLDLQKLQCWSSLYNESLEIFQKEMDELIERMNKRQQMEFWNY